MQIDNSSRQVPQREAKSLGWGCEPVTGDVCLRREGIVCLPTGEGTRDTVHGEHGSALALQLGHQLWVLCWLDEREQGPVLDLGGLC